MFGLSLVLLASLTTDRTVAWTCSQSVSGMVEGSAGRVFVATRGGLLERQTDGSWIKRTVVDGLPSNELTGVEWVNGALVLQCESGAYQSNGQLWDRMNVTIPSARLTSARVVAKPFTGLTLAGKPLDPPFPRNALPLTSIVGTVDSLVVGTVAHGVWELKGRTWRHLDMNEPSGNSVVAVKEFQGSTFVSTLDEGLNELKGGKWTVVKGLSSTAPREMVEQDGALWIRHASGQVDRFRDGHWETDVLRSVLPRKEARYLASDGKRLFVAQWGGWSMFEAGQWRHELQHPGMAGAVTTCLLPEGDRLWIGTQGKCVALADLKTGIITWIDERSGMPDDWVTCLEEVGGDVYAGTFVGGLVRLTSQSASPIAKTTGENVTCIVNSDGLSCLATRNDIYKLSGQEIEKWNTLMPTVQREVQAMFASEKGLWIGTRSGLYWVGR